MTLKPTNKQHLAYQILNDNTTDFLLFGGAAGGGKSWLICEWLLTMCIMYPETSYFIGRSELKRLRQSTLQTFFKVSKHHNLSTELWKYNGQDNIIKFSNGSKIDLLDLAYLPTKDPLFERFGSLEYTSGCIEEAGEVVFAAFDTLKTRIGRTHNEKHNIKAKILLTANPKKNWLHSFFYKPFKNGNLEDNKAFIQSYVQDNTFLDNGYIEKLESITDKTTRQRLLLGDWDYDDDDNNLLSFDDIDSVFSVNNIDSQEKYISADIARYGSDKAVLMVWQGLQVVERKTFDYSSLETIKEAILLLERKYKVKRKNIIADADGVGGGVVDALRCKEYHANRKTIVTGKKQKDYENLKTQCSYKLVELIQAGEVGINKNIFSEEEIETIKDELQMLKRADADSDGKLKIMKKKDIKLLIGRSPDYLDTLVMRMFYELKNKKNWLL